MITQAMEKKMETNACRMENKIDEMKNKMDANMQAFRSDMQCLQAGIMAPPRAGADKLRESANCVGPAVEDKIIRETCWTKLVTAERVTVTEREKLNGVTETCTRHIVTREIIKKTTEIKTPETREIEKVEERLHDKDGVKDEHTHGVSEGS